MHHLEIYSRRILLYVLELQFEFKSRGNWYVVYQCSIGCLDFIVCENQKMLRSEYTIFT